MNGEPVEVLDDVCRSGWYGPGKHLHTCEVPWPHDGAHVCGCGATLLATEPDEQEEES